MTRTLIAAALLCGVAIPAQAVQLACSAPTVVVGNSDPGSNPIKSVWVTTTGYTGGAWDVTYTFSNGTIVRREDQYGLADTSTTTDTNWMGRLHKVPRLVMYGEIRHTDSGFMYREVLFDTSKPGQPKDQIIVEMAASCERMDAPPVVTPAPAPAVAKPVVAITQAPSPSTGNSVPLMISNGAMFAGATLGDQPVVMQVDTGANLSTVEETVAGQLLSTHQATLGQDGDVKLADGSKHTVQHIVIGTVTVAGHQAHNVLAGVVPDGSGMLLGLVLMNQISPTFTVDLAKSRILLGS